MNGVRLFMTGDRHEKDEIKAYFKTFGVDYKVKRIKFEHSEGITKMWFFLYEGNQSVENDLIMISNGNKLW